MRKMTTDKDNFDHGGATGDGFAPVEKPSKRAKKDRIVDDGATERPASNIRIKTPHGLTFNPIQQAHAMLQQLWTADNTIDFRAVFLQSCAKWRNSPSRCVLVLFFFLSLPVSTKTVFLLFFSLTTCDLQILSALFQASAPFFCRSSTTGRCVACWELSELGAAANCELF
jgi:hypothetical protein